MTQRSQCVTNLLRCCQHFKRNIQTNLYLNQFSLQNMSDIIVQSTTWSLACYQYFQYRIILSTSAYTLYTSTIFILVSISPHLKNAGRDATQKMGQMFPWVCVPKFEMWPSHIYLFKFNISVQFIDQVKWPMFGSPETDQVSKTAKTAKNCKNCKNCCI